MHFHIDQTLLWMVLIMVALDAGQMLFERLRDRRRQPNAPVVWPVLDSFLTSGIVLAVVFGLFSLVGSFFPHAAMEADKWTPAKIALLVIFFVVVIVSRIFRHSAQRRSA
jgi:hypothetical protein